MYCNKHNESLPDEGKEIKSIKMYSKCLKISYYKKNLYLKCINNAP